MKTVVACYKDSMNGCVFDSLKGMCGVKLCPPLFMICSCLIMNVPWSVKADVNGEFGVECRVTIGPLLVHENLIYKMSDNQDL